MIKAVVSNGFIKNCISTASKKCKKKGLPHYFNATAPIFLLFMNICWSGIVAANHRTSIHEALLIWTSRAKVAEIDDETLCPEISSSISTRPPGRLEPNARGRGRDEV